MKLQYQHKPSKFLVLNEVLLYNSLAFFNIPYFHLAYTEWYIKDNINYLREIYQTEVKF